MGNMMTHISVGSFMGRDRCLLKSRKMIKKYGEIIVNL